MESYGEVWEHYGEKAREADLLSANQVLRRIPWLQWDRPDSWQHVANHIFDIILLFLITKSEENAIKGDVTVLERVADLFVNSWRKE